MTERLYYSDSHLMEFSAKVLKCDKKENGWAVVLDATAFFPGGGGQKADSGLIGGAAVTGMEEKDGELLHYINQPLTEGQTFDCRVDKDTRFRRMRNHSGEHIVSGTVHRLYGYDNVGFHMGEEFVTIDFSGEIDAGGLERVERLANEAVMADLEVFCSFPSAEELKTMEYRSKKELTGEVRIVTIPGVDQCACCAPHVKRTGEIGLIKILSSMRHRGGVRLDMVCGLDAYEDARIKQESVCAISRKLSAKPCEVEGAVDRLREENERQKLRCGELSRQVVAARLAAMPQTEGNICIFDDALDEPALRELINGAVTKCSGLAAVFSGSDENGYRYIIGSRSCDLRSLTTALNTGIGGKGGGRREMIQGSAVKSAKDIQVFLNNFTI